MRRKTHPIANVANGMDVSLDPVLLLDTALPNARGVRFDGGLIKKDFGLTTTFGSNMSNTVLGFDTLYLSSGSEYLCAFTTNQFYSYDSVNSNFVSRNANFTGGLDDQFDSVSTVDANGNDMIIVTNGKDPAKKWTGSGNCSNLGGVANVTFKYVVPYMSRLIIGYVTEGGTTSPRRIKWSAVGNPEDFTLANGGGISEMLDTPDFLSGLKLLRDRLFIFKEQSIWELSYVGSPKIFEPRMIVEKIGTVAPKSIVSMGDRLIFFGNDNVYAFDGAQLEPIAKQMVPVFFDSETSIVTVGKLNRACGRAIKELNQYWLSLPVEGSTLPNRLYKYDFNSNAWAWQNYDITALAAFQGGAAGMPWNVDANTWANEVGIWRSSNLASNAPVIVAGSNTGQCYQDDRQHFSNHTMLFRTKSWTFGRSHRIMEMRVQAKGGPFAMRYSLDEGNSFAGGTTFGYQANFVEFAMPINKTTQHLLVEVKSTANTFELKWMDPWFIDRTRSKSIVTS